VNRVVAGIDFGGTATRLVIYEADRVIASRTFSTATLGAGSMDTRVDSVVAAILGLIPADCVLTAIGIGASGPVDVAAGIIRNPHTLPSFSGIDLVVELKRRLGVPIVLENDAVAAAIAEHRLGAGMGVERLLVVTIGTGIGVAFIEAGRALRGPNGSHPEAGHIPIPHPLPSAAGQCYCGANACWEQSASRQALQKMLSPLFPTASDDGDILSLAGGAQGREDVLAALDSYGAALGQGIAILHTVFMPEATVLAGSGAKHLDLYRRGLSRVLQRSPGFAVDAKLHVAALGNSAGAIGAALLAQDCA